MCPKDADGMENSGDPDKQYDLSTRCPNLSVQNVGPMQYPPHLDYYAYLLNLAALSSLSANRKTLSA